MLSQGPIAFELPFVEPLIGGRLMRKIGVPGGVRRYILIFTAGERRLDIEEDAVPGVRVDAAVENPALFPVPVGKTCDGIGLQLPHIDVDGNPQIGPAPLDGIAQIGEMALGVGRGIAGNDKVGAAPDQFIDAQVFEVAAVRNITTRATSLRSAAEAALPPEWPRAP
jgi:hypothetical protein